MLRFITLLVTSIAGQPPQFAFPSHYRMMYQGTVKFAVYIEYREEFVCSGVIVGDQWVLTAANCLHDRDGRRVDDHTINVVAGSTNYKNVHSSNIYLKQERLAKKIHTHPDFVYNYFSKSDLALVQVNQTFNFSTGSVAKVKISHGRWPEGNNSSRTCLSYGFGDLGPGIPNNQLRLWNTTALYGPWACPCPCTKRFQWKRLVCRKEIEGIGLCEGDTGSGLVCYDGPYPLEQDDDQEMMTKDDHHLEENVELVGVAHMTMDKFMCEYRKVPQDGCSKIPPVSTYIFLCPFNNWIRRYVPDAPPTPDRCGAAGAQHHLLQVVVLTGVIYSLYVK